MRQLNFAALYKRLRDLEEYFILAPGNARIGAELVWVCAGGAPRGPVHAGPGRGPPGIESHHIATRLLFGVNSTWQPAYKEVRYRSVGDLEDSDFIMNSVFWVGVYPGLTQEMVGYMSEIFHQIPRTSAQVRGRPLRTGARP